MLTSRLICYTMGGPKFGLSAGYLTLAGTW